MWKEQLTKYAGIESENSPRLLPGTISHLENFISTEIIKKLIADAEKIVKVHESPHTLQNCRLCQIQQLTDKWLPNRNVPEPQNSSRSYNKAD
jgi:hypothetical protein